MEENIKQRTIKFVKSQNITIKYFETKCGLSNGYVSAMRKGYGRAKLENILTAFPQLNREWLLYGEGTMLRSPYKSTATTTQCETCPVLSKQLEMANKEIESLKLQLANVQMQNERLLNIIEHLSERRSYIDYL